VSIVNRRASNGKGLTVAHCMKRKKMQRLLINMMEYIKFTDASQRAMMLWKDASNCTAAK